MNRPRPHKADRRTPKTRPERGSAPPRGGRNRTLADPAAPTQKLQKVLAQSGLGSRRDMETLISSGRVTVNGEVATIGTRVSSADQIKVAGRIVRAQSASRMPRVLLYHKPEGEIASRDDPRGRPSVFERLPALSGAKWISIGRLDFNTCGLLLFTTSGELANRMMHPRFEIEREYAVRVMGKLQQEHVQQLMQGVELDDGPARCERVDLRGGEGANTWCHVVLKEGRNRIVRRLFEKLGFVVSRLMRVRYGPVDLPSRVKRNQYYELTSDETQRLLDWLDAAQAPETEPAADAPVPPRAAGRRARG
ncbi:MAG TPA: pseudouridine synthase [Burkholderiales bacterium]|nr:pseudouridine synthase [Burkholderiales bacterium]